MKITCVQSLAPGAQTSSSGSQLEEVIIFEDDTTSEDEVEIVNSVEGSDNTDNKSGEEQDTPTSPDPIMESPESPCIVVEESTGFNGEPLNIPMEVEEAVTLIDSPESPPDVRESPESPPPTNPTNRRGLRVRFEDGITGGVAFALDNNGDESQRSNMENDEISKPVTYTYPKPRYGLWRGDHDLRLGITKEKDKKIDKIPLYSVDFKTVLDNQSTTDSNNGKEEESLPPCVPQRSCFNCLGDHTVNDCPEQLDYALISRRRRQFKSQVGDKDTRYHELPLEMKYSDFKPGVLSPALRSAMDLTKTQVPGHIYNMRKSGYPPGWFRQAAEAASGLKFYGADTVRKTKSQTEVANLLKEKLVDFPGFTSPVPAGFRDVGIHFGIPFNKKDTLDNIVKRWARGETPIQEQIAIWTANRPSGQKSSGTPAPHTVTKDDNDVIVLEPQSSTSSAKDDGPKWYDDLLGPPKPTTSRRPSSDVESIEQIYKNMIDRNVIPPGRNWSDLEYEGVSFGPRNYRVTEELERREEERKKIMASKKQDEMNLMKRARESSYERSKSPSLLDPPFSPVEFTTTYPSDPPDPTSDAADTADDDVIIVEETSGENRKKRPLDIITIDSDDEDENIQSNPDILPNPLFKKQKTSHEAEAGVAKQAPLPDWMVDEKEPSWESDDVTYPWAEKSYLEKVSTSKDTDLKKASPAAVKKVQPQEAASVTKKAIPADQLLNVLARHSEEDDVNTVSDLPPMDNFSKGMSELPLHQEATEFSGRLKKVLGIIHDKKTGQQRMQEDDDIETIE